MAEKLNIYDYPELLEAFESGKFEFVIFAGAGVSVNSGFPLFKELAEEIVGKEVPNGHDVARFLGKNKNGKDLHLECQKIFKAEKRPSKKGSSEMVLVKPNNIHLGLLDLATNNNNFRLVTTNYDKLFEMAIATRDNSEPEHKEKWKEVFSAPALPRGRDFTGLIHLHGVYDNKEKDMILTDEDFGRAYFYDRWAIRFLVELFENYSILFVGYSHEDFLMHYISKSLLRKGSKESPCRFALVDIKPPTDKQTIKEIEKEEKEKWDDWGIKPLFYSPKNDHQELEEVLADLKNEIKSTPQERKNKIQNIFKKNFSNSLIKKEEPYLKFQIKNHKVDVKSCIQHCNNTWKVWLQENGLKSKEETSNVDMKLERSKGETANQQEAIQTKNIVQENLYDPIAHKCRIEQIVSAKHRGELEEKDETYLLERVFKEPALTNFFCNAAHPSWREWLDEKGILKPLFDPYFVEHGGGRTVIRQLTEWFITHFVMKDPKEFLEYISKYRGCTSSQFASLILHTLINEKQEELGDFALLVPLLLKSGVNNAIFLSHLLRRCKMPEEEGTAFLILNYFTTPILSYGGRWSSEKVVLQLTEEDINYELFENSHKTWDKVFVAHFDTLSVRIDTLLKNQFNIAYSLQGTGEDIFDSMSYSCTTIQEPNGDGGRLSYSINYLVDMSRDLIDWMLENQPKKEKEIVQNWWDMGENLPRRLALYALCKATKTSDDYKLSWILENQLLDDSFCHPEVYQLMKTAFPGASNNRKKKFISAILRWAYQKEISREYLEGLGAYAGNTLQEKEKCTRNHDIFDILTWLRSSFTAPCDPLDEALAKIKKNYPTLKQTESPDLTHPPVETHWGPLAKPTPEEELLAHNPETPEGLKWLLNHNDPGWAGIETRDGIKEGVTKLAGNNFSWSFSLAKALANANEWESDLWWPLISGWTDNRLTPEEVHSLFQFFLSSNVTDKRGNEISSFLESFLSGRVNQQPEALTEKNIPLAFNLACKIWRRSNECDTEETATSVSGCDWMMKVTNSPAGKAVDFLLRLLNRERNISENRDIPQKYLDFFAEVVNSETIAGDLGRTPLGQHFAFFYSCKLEWTEEHLIPLLQWQDEKKNPSFWVGFLWNQRLTLGIHDKFMGAYINAIPKLYNSNLFSRDEKDALCNYLSVSALFAPKGSIEPKDWLSKSIKALGDKERTTWAGKIRWQLDRLKSEPEKIKAQWNLWLKEYWKNRNQGVPVALSPGEMEEMLEWLFPLEEVFDEVAFFVSEKYFKAIKYPDKFIYYLKGSTLAKKHPNTFTKFLTEFLKTVEFEKFHDPATLLDIYQELKEKVKEDILNNLKEQLIRLGCSCD